MSSRGDASNAPEDAGGPIREAEETDPETTLWKARRARVSTLKSVERVRAELREPQQPVIAIEYAAEPSVVSTPAVPPSIAQDSAPTVEAPTAPIAAAPSVSPRTRPSLPRGWPFVATVAVAVGGFAYVFMAKPAATVPPSAAGSSRPAPEPSGEAPLRFLRVQATISPTHATTTLDGKTLGAGPTIDQELELACPDGHHELHVEARDHRPVTKQLPCAGVVVLDVALDEVN